MPDRLSGRRADTFACTHFTTMDKKELFLRFSDSIFTLHNNKNVIDCKWMKKAANEVSLNKCLNVGVRKKRDRLSTDEFPWTC